MEIPEKEKIQRLLDNWADTYSIAKKFALDIVKYKDIQASLKEIKALWNADILGNIPKDISDEITNNTKLCINLIKQTNIKLEKSLKLKSALDAIIENLDNSYILVIKGKHIDKLNWELLPLYLPYVASKRTLQRYYNTALEQIKNALESDNQLKWVMDCIDEAYEETSKS